MADPHSPVPPDSVGPLDPAPAPEPAAVDTRAVKPDVSEYGYWERRYVPSTRAELIARCSRGKPPPLVWTPETARLVPPWEVPYLFEALRGPALTKARNGMAIWGIVLAGAVAMFAETGGTLGSPMVLWLVLAAVLFGKSVMDFRTLRKMTPAVLNAEAAELRDRPAPRRATGPYTWIVGGAILAVAALQLLAGDLVSGNLLAGAGETSVRVAGLMKDAVREGEVWRMLTAALLHGGLLHLLFNFTALDGLGRIVEAYSHRAFVPLLFVLSALGASAASMAAYPSTPSLGASGGIMGLFGFLAVIGMRRRHLMPRGFGRSIAVDVALIALMGIAGYQFIDNAAHAGGLVTGALIGLLAIPREGEHPYWTPSRAVRVAGDFCLGVIVIAAVATMGLLVPVVMG
ncbi:MAG TPA: rhomboid family intramembrane serine protease [Longimicrobium sp.]|nr:rhomboid family intramembrane serine protease [Longimicrobium sp.]